MHDKVEFIYQDELYAFPYHYLPTLDNKSRIRLHRQLSWGLDYMTYMSFVADSISRLSPRSLCDVGCGDGRLLHMVKSFVPAATGIDLSERAIAFARAFNPEANCLHGDIATLAEQYEMVTLVEVLEHIPDDHMSEFVAHVARLLPENGYLMVTVPTINLPLNKKHYRHYNLQILTNSLNSHFYIEDHWWLYRRGYIERVIRSFLCNRFYALNLSPLLQVIWKLHKRLTSRVLR
jgi:SAM-dependent methyltransferase